MDVMPQTGGSADAISRKRKILVVDQCLRESGYLKVSKQIYRGLWSSVDVEHLIFLSFYGKPGKFMVVEFALKNSYAEQFSIKVLKNIVGGVYSMFTPSAKFGATMRFSLGRVANWKPRGSLVIDDLDCVEIESKLISDINEYILPITRLVVNSESLLSAFVRDDESLPWLVTNGALRAAQIIWIAAFKFGLEYEDIRFLLKERERYVDLALKNSSITVEKFLYAVFYAIKSA